MKLSTRELSTLAVFGALWGLVEISMGSVLKTLDVPLTGMVLSAIGLTIALTGRVFVPRRGSILFIGVIAMLLKLFSLGGVVIGPMVGIFTESLVAEAVLTLVGKSHRSVSVLAGAMGVAWVLVQPFVTGPLLFGRTLIDVWLELLDMSANVLGFAPSAVIWVIIVLLVIHLVTGAAAGWLSWDIAQMLQKRLGHAVPVSIREEAQEKGSLVKYISVGVLFLFGGLLIAYATLAFSVGKQPPDDTGPILLVSGGEISRAYTRTDLESLALSQADFNGVTYVGVNAAVLLQDAGFNLDDVTVVTALAADGYTVSYEPAQILADDVIVAYARANGDLVDDEGPFRMVLPGAEGSFNVRMLVNLQLVK